MYAYQKSPSRHDRLSLWPVKSQVVAVLSEDRTIVADELDRNGFRLVAQHALKLVFNDHSQVSIEGSGRQNKRQQLN